MNMSEETLNASKEEVSLWQIFTVFAKIGAFTIGGGYAMIPLIRDEMIKRDWMSDEELPDIISMAQSAPGVLAVNMSIFVGHKLRGVKGCVVATLGDPVLCRHPADSHGVHKFQGQPRGRTHIQRYPSCGRVADRCADDQYGQEEQQDLVGLGDFGGDAVPGRLPELFTGLHTVGADCGFRRHRCHQGQKGGAE